MASITLNLFVSDIAAALASFDVIRIRRSIAGEGGPYTEITAPAATSASLLSTNSGPYSVSGNTLSLKVDSQPQVDVVFSGVDPLTVNQVVSQINDAVGSAVASEVGGAVQLESLLSGTVSKMEVVGGSAAPLIGFIDGQRDIGEDPYITLQAGVTDYQHIDNDGDSGYFYQSALYHTGTGLLSEWSSPFEGEAGTLVGSSNLSVCSVDWVDASGVALPEQTIVFYPLNEPLEVDGYQVALSRQPVSMTTDNSGHAEISLVRGLKVKVVFEGTSLIRTITVPDTATFSLLQLMSEAPDPFNPIRPDYPTAPRRTI